MGDDANNNAGGDNGGGGGAAGRPAWMSSLPDSLKENTALAQFQEPAAAWTKFVDLLGAEGKAITIPGENATEAERAAFYQKIGRPENSDGYKITKPTDLPEEIPYDQALETEFKKFAHENGLTSAQAEKAYGWYYGLVKNGYAQEQQRVTQARTEAENQLKTVWGPKYAENQEVAVRAFKTFGKGAESLLTEAKIGNTKLGDHPEFLKLFYEIGLKTMDDKATFGKEGGGKIVDLDKQTAEKMFPSMTK